MTYEITKVYDFSAGHRLSGLPPEHKCSRVHGHGYQVQVRVATPRLDATGFVVDYAGLDPFAAWLKDTFDHRWLGTGVLLDEDGGKTEPVFDGNPTAENLAAAFRAWLDTEGNVPALWPAPGGRIRPLTVEVGVSETPKTWAWAR